MAVKGLVLLVALAAFAGVVLAADGAVDIKQLMKERKQSEIVSNDSHVLSPFTCTPGPSSAMCNYHGTCADTGDICMCDDGYITFDETDKQCNYKQKSALTTFLLAFFLGAEFGAGYWYAGQTGLAVGQLVLFWGGLMFICCATFACGMLSGSGEGAKMSMACFGFLWSIGVLIFWFYAWITAIKGDIKDGNNAPIPSL